MPVQITAHSQPGVCPFTTWPNSESRVLRTGFNTQMTEWKVIGYGTQDTSPDEVLAHSMNLLTPDMMWQRASNNSECKWDFLPAPLALVANHWLLASVGREKDHQVCPTHWCNASLKGKMTRSSWSDWEAQYLQENLFSLFYVAAEGSVRILLHFPQWVSACRPRFLQRSPGTFWNSLDIMKQKILCCSVVALPLCLGVEHSELQSLTWTSQVAKSFQGQLATLLHTKIHRN